MLLVRTARLPPATGVALFTEFLSDSRTTSTQRAFSLPEGRRSLPTFDLILTLPRGPNLPHKGRFCSES